MIFAYESECYKFEGKAGLANFSGCNNVRVFGHGGLGTPDSAHGYAHLYLFTNCANFLISNVGDDIQPGASQWIGTCWYRWINATLGSFVACADEPADGARIAPGGFERPIVYLRGEPGAAVPEPWCLLLLCAGFCVGRVIAPTGNGKKR